MNMENIDFISRSEADTFALAESLCHAMPHGGVIHSGIALRPLLASAMAHGFMLRRTSGCRHAGHRIGLRRGGLAMPHCGMFG